MKIYLDSADLDEIKQAHALGFISGVTTNPSLMAKAGNTSVIDTVREIANLCFEHISVEPNCTDVDEFVKESYKLFQIAPAQIVIKVPVNADGFMIIKRLRYNYLDVKCLNSSTKVTMRLNATLVFTPEQATLVDNSNADYCSVFFGRIEDSNIQFKTQRLFKEYLSQIQGNCLSQKTIAASIRSIEHFNIAKELRYDIATVPFKVLMEILNNQKTADGVKQFLEAK